VSQLSSCLVSVSRSSTLDSETIKDGESPQVSTVDGRLAATAIEPGAISSKAARADDHTPLF
jgi:hypothetical protein